jgi:hypothetical protein
MAVMHIWDLVTIRANIGLAQEGPARYKFLDTQSGVVVTLSLLRYFAASLPFCVTLKKLLRSF